MKEPQLSGIAKALAAQGRKGDTELIHVSKDELAALRKHGAALGINLTTNPSTGLPEAFNWGGMLGSVGLPLLLTIATGGAAAPWMLAAAGAAGGAGGTMLGGGSTDQALVSGLMGGIGGYGMGGIGESLAAAGEAAAAKTLEEGATQAGQAAVTEAGAQTAGQAGAQTAAQTAGAQTQASLGGINAANFPNIPAEQYASTIGSWGPGGANLPAAQIAENLGKMNYMSGVPATEMPGLMTQSQAMGKGLEAVTASPSAFGNFASSNLKNIGMAGIGALGAGTSMNPQEQTITTEPESTDNPYKGEMFMDPATGQWRSRAVRRARGGEIYGDYEGVEEAPDGGYAPGGGLNFAGGGGIGDLGGYSDGGRLLRGPGDGVSDNIPATIEGKRPARLADGEFVIPARAVSELGNGSTEAGSKQLYKMLDRIAAKRKSGKGLAYNADPKKLMPA